MTYEGLAGRQTALHAPLVEYLREDEVVKWLFTDKSGGITEIREADSNPYIQPRDGSNTVYLLTDERLVIVVPQADEDTVLEIEYESLVEYSSTHDVYVRYQENTIGVSRITIGIRTADKHYRLRICVEYLNQCTACLKYVRTQMHEEYERILTTSGVPKLGLSILDRDTGEAEMEMSGWQYGLGFVDRQRSTSQIEQKGYETYATDFVVLANGIRVTYKEADGGDLVSFRRLYDEFDAVDLTSSGFIIYTSDGIYKFDYRYERDAGVDKQTMTDVGKHIRANVQDAKAADDDPSRTDEKLETLKQLADLHDQGVLTDAEFETKKAEILEEI